jgi:hypothetical protein
LTASRTSGDSTRRSAFPTDLFHPDFPALCAHLTRRGADYIVLGGWAAIAHGVPRSTHDVDIFVRPTKENVQRVIDALSEVGFGIARELTPEEILGRSVFLFADQIRVDIFIRPWGLKDYEGCFARRREIEFESVRIPFLGLEDLILSKDTDRPQDRADLESLREIARRRGAGG